MKTWIVATDDRRIGGLVAQARKVGGEVEAAVVGSEALANQIAQDGVDKVVCFPVADDVPPEAAAATVAAAAKEAGVDVVLSNDGPASRVILGAVAGALGAAVVGNAVDVSADGGVAVDRMIANGKAVETVAAPGAVAAIYVGPDEDIAAGSAPVEVMPAPAASDKIAGVAESGGSGLASAQRVVGVGMGVGARDNLPVVEALAQQLGAEIACTLPCCDDMRWYTSDHVLGSSHNTAAPDLYIAVGISGSPNHTSGFRDAKVAVAINKDPDAEIFNHCKYGITGDLFDVVPVLTQALQ